MTDYCDSEKTISNMTLYTYKRHDIVMARMLAKPKFRLWLSFFHNHKMNSDSEEL